VKDAALALVSGRLTAVGTRAEVVDQFYRALTAAAPPPPSPNSAPPAAPPPPQSDGAPGVEPAGDVADDVQCLNTQSDGSKCNHLASAHADTDTGTNTGPCSMVNCDCPGIRVPGETPVDDTDQPTAEGNNGQAEIQRILAFAQRGEPIAPHDVMLLMYRYGRGFDLSPGLAVGALPYWAFISQADRDKAASSGAAMPDGSYPILSCSGENSVDSAISAVGRGSADHDAIRRHIQKRAKSLGCVSKIPDNWNADGSLKDAAAVQGGTGFAAPTPGPSAAAPDVSPAALGPAFTIPVAVTEGTLTDDGRTIAPQALDWRNPPMPLMYLNKTPEFGGHAGAVLVGVIEAISRDGTTISGNGHFLTTEDALDAAQALEQMGRLGISIDVGNVIEDIEAPIEMPLPIGPSNFDDTAMPVTTLTQGTIMAMTMCTQPAFPGAYIVMGDGSADPGSIPAQRPVGDGEEAAIEAIHVLDFESCEPCADGALTASAAPSRPPSGWFLMDEPDEVTPMRVEEDGRVYGHVPWGVCHTGSPQGQCLVAPKGGKYSYRRFTAGYVLTAEGDEIPTGPITVNTTHADLSLWAPEAQAHYVHTGKAIADVAVRDGVHGLWFCGALRPWATEEDVRLLRASVISPDWRRVGNHWEMIAALAVNYGGFPVTRMPRMRARVADGAPRSLVASGVAEQLALRAGQDDPGQAAYAALTGLWGPLSRLAVRDLRDRMAATRS